MLLSLTHGSIDIEVLPRYMNSYPQRKRNKPGEWWKAKGFKTIKKSSSYVKELSKTRNTSHKTSEIDFEKTLTKDHGDQFDILMSR